MMRVITARAALVLVVAAGCGGSCRAHIFGGDDGDTAPDGSFYDAEAAEAELPVSYGPPVEVRGHPRLWITEKDVDRLRKRADKPIFREGLNPLADELRQQMDNGQVPDDDCIDKSTITCESYAQLFAFMSLVHPDKGERDDYGQRAHKLLMHVINEAARGVKEDDPLRNPKFSVDDRSRWSGESFALTVDWIYPRLSAADKKTIRKVFLRWSKEQLHAKVTNNNHPVPIGLIRDKKLIADRNRNRWAGNNYYAAHTRNLGLMAMALDPEDDPDGELRQYLQNATGAWLYIIDHLQRTDARGGLGPEGLQYQQQTMGYVAQLLLALETAGLADESRFGRQVVLDKNPFWDNAMRVYYHIQSPVKVELDWRGPQHFLAWYGDGQKYEGIDFIDLIGTLGIHAERRGNRERLDLARWMQKYSPAGGAAKLYDRIRSTSNPREAVLYYLLNPDGAPRKNPAKKLPLHHYAEGLGHIYARTSWGEDATWFRYILGWISIDHQHAEGNHFGFYRNGEWLTKKRVGYSYTNLSSTKFHNSVTVVNGRPEHDDPSDYRSILWKNGSQWTFGGATGDGEIRAVSLEDDYLFVHGDATGLYNSEYEGVADINHVSRSLLWLKPDVIVVFDRVATKVSGRERVFWLQVPKVATVSGKRARVVTGAGQQLFVTSLLPEDSRISSAQSEPFEKEVAEHEMMNSHIRIEPGTDRKKTRFLTVLEGADGGATAAQTRAVKSTSGDTMEGAVIGTTLVLFTVKVSKAFKEVTYSVPAGVKEQFVTGLAPNTGYSVERSGDQVTIRPGTGARTDAGGVLRIAK